MSCGSTDSFDLSEVGKTANLSMTLTRGDVCFFKIKNNCGLLKTDLILVEYPNDVIVEFIEFAQD